jgi:hypothetical protein
MEAALEHGNCQEGGGRACERGEKAAFLPENGHFLVQKRLFFGALQLLINQ